MAVQEVNMSKADVVAAANVIAVNPEADGKALSGMIEASQALDLANKSLKVALQKCQAMDRVQ